MTRKEFTRQLEELLSSPVPGQPLKPNKTGLWIEWVATCAHNTLELQRRISHAPKEHPSTMHHYYEQAIMDRLYAVFQRIRNLYGREIALTLYFQEQPTGLFHFEMMGVVTHLPLELWELLYPRLREINQQSDNGETKHFYIWQRLITQEKDYNLYCHFYERAAMPGSTAL